MGVFDLIFPRKCFGCRKDGYYICPSCAKKLKPSRQVCGVCSRPSTKGMTHLGCKTPHSLDRLASIWEYEGGIRKAILALKYKFALEITREVSELIAKEMKKERFIFPSELVLVPVPLHWHRANWRGFNQVEEIGKLVAKEMGWKFIPDLLQKKIPTVPQTELKREERLKNIRGIFSLNPRYNIQDTKYPVLIFDDVWTTGSTIKEAAKMLKRGGAKEIWGFTIAKGR